MREGVSMQGREAFPPRGEGFGGGFPLSAPVRRLLSLPEAVNRSDDARYTGSLIAHRSHRSSLAIFNGE